MATAQKTAQKGASEEPEAAPAPKPKRSKKKLLVFLMIFVVIGVLGGGLAWYFTGGEEPPPDLGNGATAEGGAAPAAKPVKAKEIKPPVFLVMEQFTVNLQPEGSTDQYLQVAFSLQVPDQETVDVIKLYMPQVRSRLLLLLSGKKASQINTPEGKKKLASEIIEQIKQPFAPGMRPAEVNDVYFTSFVIQ